MSDGPKVISNCGGSNTTDLSHYGAWTIIDRKDFELEKDRTFFKNVLPFTKDCEIEECIAKLNESEDKYPVLDIDIRQLQSKQNVLRATLIDSYEEEDYVAYTFKKIVLAPTHLNINAGYANSNIAGKHCFGWSSKAEAKGMLKEYGY